MCFSLAPRHGHGGSPSAPASLGAQTASIRQHQVVELRDSFVPTMASDVPFQRWQWRSALSLPLPMTRVHRRFSTPPGYLQPRGFKSFIPSDQQVVELGESSFLFSRSGLGWNFCSSRLHLQLHLRFKLWPGSASNWYFSLINLRSTNSSYSVFCDIVSPFSFFMELRKLATLIGIRHAHKCDWSE